MDIFRQIGQFLKGLDKENKMTLISLRITHFQGHQSQKKKLIRNMIQDFLKMRNFLIKKFATLILLLTRSEWQVCTENYAGRGSYFGTCTPGLYQGAHIHTWKCKKHEDLVWPVQENICNWC